MKYLIKKSETVDADEHGISTFHDYQFPFTNASLGVSEIHKSYPPKGWDVDREVDGYWYVEDGEAEIVFITERFHVEKGDMIFIPKGEKYKIETSYIKLVVCSTPAWFAAQHDHLEE